MLERLLLGLAISFTGLAGLRADDPEADPVPEVESVDQADAAAPDMPRIETVAPTEPMPVVVPKLPEPEVAAVPKAKAPPAPAAPMVQKPAVPAKTVAAPARPAAAPGNLSIRVDQPEPRGPRTVKAVKVSDLKVLPDSTSVPPAMEPFGFKFDGADRHTPEKNVVCMYHSCCPAACPPRVWADVEYLMWWIADHPLPVTLLSTGPLDDPNAVSILGGRDMDTELRNGGRLFAGAWIDDEKQIGIEAGYFFLGRRSEGDEAGSEGLPPLGYPVVGAGGFGFLPLALPDQFVDVTTLNVATFLQGWEVNALVNVVRDCNFSLDLIAGGRYVDLDEKLALGSVSPGFGTIPSFNFLDTFNTQNQFYGGQIGFRGEVTRGRFFVNATGKVAIGSIRQEVDIDGVFLFNDVPSPPPGGFYSKPTNLGHHSRNRFTFIPEATVNLGVQVIDGLRAYVGYNFLLIPDVVRPGSEIDPAIDAGLLRPTVPFRKEIFWAQGLNFGLELGF